MSKLNFLNFSVICLTLALPSIYFLPGSVSAKPPEAAQAEPFDKENVDKIYEKGNIGKTYAQIQEELGIPTKVEACTIRRVVDNDLQEYQGNALIYLKKAEDVAIVDAICFVRGMAVSEKVVLLKKSDGRASRVQIENVDYTLLQEVMASPKPTTADRLIAPGIDDLDI